MGLINEKRLINGKVGFLDTIKKKTIKTKKTGIRLQKSQKVKLFQLFKRIAKDLDIFLSLEEAFPFPITILP